MIFQLKNPRTSILYILCFVKEEDDLPRSKEKKQAAFDLYQEEGLIIIPKEEAQGLGKFRH